MYTIINNTAKTKAHAKANTYKLFLYIIYNIIYKNYVYLNNYYI